jgi:hypothetical protein
MATPAERAVIAAARAYMMEPGVHEGTPGRGKLAAAVRALDAAEHPTADGPAETSLTWGQLVADDELWSAKAGKWFTVLEAKHVPTPGNDVGETQVRLKGGASFRNPSNVTARVRRSAMGEAVDLFATVIWSGPNGAAS